jgi:thioredoxin reductase (NADPH)
MPWAERPAEAHTLPRARALPGTYGPGYLPPAARYANPLRDPGAAARRPDLVSSMSSPESLVIIGSGPAAWTAAIYAARANLNPVVFEGEPSRMMLPGGQLMFTTEVENYPGFPDGVTGPEMMQRFKDQAERFNTRIVSEDIRSVDFSTHPFTLTPNYSDPITAFAVIIATGARANWLGLPNEERLAQSGGGVSACAVCDGALPFYRDKVLAVVGGGDSAMEESLYLTKFATEVLIIHRRDQFRASPIMADRVLNHPKIRVLWNTEVTEVLGYDEITGVRLRDTVDGSARELEVGGLFVAIGHTPNTGFLDGQVELHPTGYICTPEPWRTSTSVPGVFAAGDVMDSYFRQAITAAGTGCMAALEAERWLAHHGFGESPVPETSEAPGPALDSVESATA